MPTYAQLQSEPYWGREVVTDELDWLGDELCRRTSRPRTAFGTKGDNHHMRGAHRSQEWIRRSTYCTNRTYTVQSGLTAEQERHIAGVDFTPGSAEDMVAQCKRIYVAMRAGYLDEVLAMYGNVDGDRVVDGWDNVRDRPASSDSSHLWHWHLTIDRRHCRDRKLMERILAVALGEPVEDDVTPEDINAIAAATAAKVLGSPAASWMPDSPSTGGSIYEINGRTKAIYALVAKQAGTDLVDEPAIIAGVLAGLDPAVIAAAIPQGIAKQVADELGARLTGATSADTTT